jgi:undecaprenyl diphosphate synthase
MITSEQAKRLEGVTIPQHLAVIPDGNRRWAEREGKDPTEGHRKGYEVAKELSRFCREIGIHTVTVWAFSTENWKRSPGEVATLMALYEEWMRDLLPEAIEENVRVVHLGRKLGVPSGAKDHATDAGYPQGLPETLVRAIVEIERKTADNTANLLNLSINYGGEDEIQRATERLLDAARDADPSRLRIQDFLDTSDQPHPRPDVVWRTSGELRVSGFLPMQSAYAEMVFTPKLFPDLSKDDVIDVVCEYSARKRRFGG